MGSHTTRYDRTRWHPHLTGYYYQCVKASALFSSAAHGFRPRYTNASQLPAEARFEFHSARRRQPRVQFTPQPAIDVRAAVAAAVEARELATYR